MKLSEFKAWFEGYTENVAGAPSKKQWDRIKEQVGKIDGVAVTERVYVDRYWPHNPPQRWYWKYPGYLTAAGAVGMGVALAGQNTAVERGFNSRDAMYALGKAEAEAEAA